MLVEDLTATAGDAIVSPEGPPVRWLLDETPTPELPGPRQLSTTVGSRFASLATIVTKAVATCEHEHYGARSARAWGTCNMCEGVSISAAE